ncbi:MAG TPA: hypothetical protein VKM55_04565 [Candidatus Lokiarchaeia archaeon]|nr:hypothetical protein [Candidatus Lokiarchaeia archaeon]
MIERCHYKTSNRWVTPRGRSHVMILYKHVVILYKHPITTNLKVQ